MFKKKTAIAITSLSMMFSGTAMADKIGFIDFQQVLTQSEYAKRVTEQATKELEVISTEINALRQSLEQLDQKAKKDGLTMSAAQRERLSKEIRSKSIEFKLKEALAQDEVKFQEKKTIDLVSKKAMAEIEKISKAEGYDLIIKREAIIYATEAVDITDQLINALK